MYMHALHTVHALPDLRVAAGRFAGRFSIIDIVDSENVGMIEC